MLQIHKIKGENEEEPETQATLKRPNYNLEIAYVLSIMAALRTSCDNTLTFFFLKTFDCCLFLFRG